MRFTGAATAGDERAADRASALRPLTAPEPAWIAAGVAGYTTLEFTVNYLRPVTAAAGDMVAAAGGELRTLWSRN